MNEPFKYDVFMSYGAHDRGEARALAERLRRDGLRVWPGVFDDDAQDEAIQTNQIGGAARNQPAAGLEQARTLVLLLSQHATAAEWVTFEQHAVRLRRPAESVAPTCTRATGRRRDARRAQALRVCGLAAALCGAVRTVVGRLPSGG